MTVARHMAKTFPSRSTGLGRPGVGVSATGALGRGMLVMFWVAALALTATLKFGAREDAGPSRRMRIADVALLLFSFTSGYASLLESRLTLCLNREPGFQAIGRTYLCDAAGSSRFWP